MKVKKAGSRQPEIEHLQILNLRVRAITALLAAFFLVTGMLTAQPHENISLISRIDFAPALLEMISSDLQTRIRRPCSLNFQPVEGLKSINADAFSSILLVEEGVDSSILPAGRVKSPIEIRLVWVLAVHKKAVHLIKNAPLTLESFAKILIDGKKSEPDKFPWFEALVSRNTLRNFCVVLGERDTRPQTPGAKTGSEFWLQQNGIAVLNKALEAELLNPLSVEADLSLAMEVFAAGDALFVSHWVPADYLRRPSDHLPAQTLLVPFPDQSGTGKIPEMHLHLWLPADSELNAKVEVSSDTAQVSQQFIALDYASETAWIEKNHTENYDSLIMGDL